MATNRSGGHRPGGGIASKNVANRTAPKVEPRARAINPGGVNMLGSMVGDHATHGNPKGTGFTGEKLIRGSGYNNPVGPTNMAASGPGAGREVHKSGSQQQYGSGGPQKPGGRDILGSFGPESSRRGEG